MLDVVHPVFEDGAAYFYYIGAVAAADTDSLLRTCDVVAMLHHKWNKEAKAANQKQIQIENLRKIKWEPPLVKFHCETCGDTWDAWVADDGSLEDKWSVVCTNSKCTAHGYPAVIASE